MVEIGLESLAACRSEVDLYSERANFYFWQAASSRVTESGLHSILHISDLHRSTSDPVENSEVISSLLSDADRYVNQSPPVKNPDIIVVSGDVIQGVALGERDYDRIVKEQYQQADRLLGEICDRFVDGDRTKVAICAGNHDVCWNTALSAMEKIDDDAELGRLGHQDFFNPGSQYRWDWKNKCAYKIVDRALYDSRLDKYWNFVEGFFEDTNLKFPIDKKRGYSLFEVLSGRVVVASFNSLSGNDCFAYHGSITGGDIADCSMALRDCGQNYALKVAVWHHGIFTPPPSTDFMSMDPIFDLANHGFGLGLHGHQHQAAHTVHYIHVPEQRRFPIVSAGSLCAGSRELPTGQNRQYNIIELQEDFASGKVHVRERTKANVFTASMRPEFGINGAIDLTFDPPDMRSQQAASNLAEMAEARQIAIAEEHLRAGRAGEAVDMLVTCDLTTNFFARQIFFEAAKESEDWESLVLHASPPATVAELAVVCDAVSKTDGIDAAIALARNFNISTPQESAMRDEIVSRLSALKLIGS